MSILSFLTGTDPEKLEKKGDALLTSGSWGEAKLDYERALAKAEKKGRLSPSRKMRLTGKIAKATEGLAAEHQKTAEDYMEAGYYDDAASYLSLARKITTSENRTWELTKLEERLDVLRRTEAEKTAEEEIDEYYGLSDDQPEEEVHEEPPEAQFHVLLAVLPSEIQEIYLSYNEDFRTGYLALNAGDFETAAVHLARAAAEDSDPGSYIPLELATAYLHLGRLTEARELLVAFLGHHPDALPAYQLLCDIYWIEKDFHQADTLIDSVPESLADSLAVLLLRGETRFHAGDFDAAETLYQTFIERHGWQTEIALALAKTHEAAGNNEKARHIYQEIMGNCTGCGTKIDPAVKHKYAELSFAAGIYDTHILELYLDLAQQIPNMAPEYYARVSRIYTEQGNETEAARFRMIARRASE